MSHNLLLVRVFYLIYHKLHQAETDARSVLLFASPLQIWDRKLYDWKTDNFWWYFLSTFPVNKPIMKIDHHNAKKYWISGVPVRKNKFLLFIYLNAARSKRYALFLGIYGRPAFQHYQMLRYYADWVIKNLFSSMYQNHTVICFC